MSLWWTVSNHRCVEVGRTPRLSSSTCLVLFLPTSTRLTVHHSDTWRTVVPTKAAAVAETSTTTMDIKVVI